MLITTQETYAIAERALVLEGILEGLNEVVGETIDAIQFQSVSVHLLPGWTGAVNFEVTNDITVPSSWVSRSLQGAGGATLASSTSGSGVYAGDIGARYFRLRAATYTTGPIPFRIEFSPDSQAAGSAAAQAVSNTMLGTAAGAGWKAEDAVHTSGDVGMLTLGLRQAAVPVVTTSAAGDYSSYVVDAEGKQIIAGTSTPEASFNVVTTVTNVTTDVVLKASAGAGLRNFVTDITLSNISATATIVDIKDGTTIIHSILVPAGATAALNLHGYLKGTAATAINIATRTAVTSILASVIGFIGV